MRKFIRQLIEELAEKTAEKTAIQKQQVQYWQDKYKSANAARDELIAELNLERQKQPDYGKAYTEMEAQLLSMQTKIENRDKEIQRLTAILKERDAEINRLRQQMSLPVTSESYTVEPMEAESESAEPDHVCGDCRHSKPANDEEVNCHIRHCPMPKGTIACTEWGRKLKMKSVPKDK